MRVGRAVALFLLPVLILVSLPGCGERERTPREVYEAFSARYGLPPHLTFDSEAGQNDAAYLSDKDFNLLFSRADGSDDREDIASFVLCLGASGTVFYECGFFRCVDRAGAREVEGLCILRCETVPLEELGRRIAAGEVTDGKTLAIYLKAELLRKEGDRG